jgi:hypothetical protein
VRAVSPCSCFDGLGRLVKIEPMQVSRGGGRMVVLPKATVMLCRDGLIVAALVTRL